MNSEQPSRTLWDSVEEPKYEYAIVETDDGLECTIYPQRAVEDETVTCWITAGAGAYVSLESVR